MSNSNGDKVSLTKFPTPSGEGYRAGDTYYLYLHKPLKEVSDHLRYALKLPSAPALHNRTESFREWARENNIPVPKDEDNLYNYVVTVGDSEIPTIWPSRAYMRKHRTLSASTMESYVPTVVYPIGTATMCRFGHRKSGTKSSSRNSCNKCRWWRLQGIDLSVFQPTHCLQGHPLKDNRWLEVRYDRSPKVHEKCVQCNNERIMNKYGYTPNS